MADAEVGAQDFWRDLLEQNAATRGEAPAISRRLIGGRYEHTSHRELLELVRSYARLFVATTSPGQVIPLCLSRGAECAAAMLAALMSGRAFCCVNQKLRAPQLALIFDLLDSPIALVDGQGLLALTDEALESPRLLSTRWHLVSGQALTRAAERALAQLALGANVVRQSGDASISPETHETYACAQTGQDLQLAGCCLFTSGSTGVPKGVLISGADLTRRARGEVSWLGLTRSDVLLGILPFSFDVGLNQLLASIIAGAELVVLESWLPSDVLGTVAARGVTGIAAVPTIWAEFMTHRRSFDRAQAHRSLRFLTVSGGDLSPAQHAQLVQIAGGADIFKTYGQTETFRTTSLRPEEYHARPLSVGRALPEVRLYVARPDGTRASPGETGEVVHTGIGTMLGYLGTSAHDPKLRPNPWRGEGDPNPLAVFTGDFGCLDEEGYLYLQGRRDDMIKISGNRVYPAEVKALITSLPGVGSAEVVAVQHAGAAQLAAFVVPFSDLTLASDELLRELKRCAPSYMVPALLVVRSELPRTASGKPDRTRLMEQARALLQTDAATTGPLRASSHAKEEGSNATS